MGKTKRKLVIYRTTTMHNTKLTSTNIKQAPKRRLGGRWVDPRGLETER